MTAAAEILGKPCVGKRFDEDTMMKFAAALATGGTVKCACEAIGIKRHEAYRQRDTDPLFAEIWKIAIEDAADTLEAEAIRRAVHGFEITTQVKSVRETNTENSDKAQTANIASSTESRAKKYSDGLLVLLLRAARPEKFGGRVTSIDASFEDEMARDRDPPVIERGCTP